MLPKTPHLPISAKAEIGAATFDLYLADQHPTCVPNVDSISTPRIYISKNVALDAVRSARVGIGKDPSIGKERRLVFPVDTISVDCCWAPVISVSVTMNEVGIGYVNGAFIRRETKTIRSAKPIRYDTYIAGGRVEAVDELGQDWLRAETLLVTVDGICEPDRAVGVYNHVIWGIEGPRMVVV